jgi:hypothetical protein
MGPYSRRCNSWSRGRETRGTLGFVIFQIKQSRIKVPKFFFKRGDQALRVTPTYGQPQNINLMLYRLAGLNELLLQSFPIHSARLSHTRRKGLTNGVGKIRTIGDEGPHGGGWGLLKPRETFMLPNRRQVNFLTSSSVADITCA